MKIETLPLLPEDFAEWSWWKVNGEADIYSLNMSYQALVQKDLCSNFSRMVWNDLINLLNETLTYSGLIWDSTYGDVSDCLFDTSLSINREFTAPMFNAAVLNINKLGIFHWNWARTNELPGYLGREYVRGYSQYREKSDFIYGWYILELATKLNKLITILKDKASFGEFETSNQIITHNPATLAVPGAAIMNYIATIWANVAAGITSTKVAPMLSTLSANDYFVSQIDAQRAAYADAFIKDFTKIDASATRLGVITLNTHAFEATISETELLPLRFVGRMIYAEAVRAIQNVSMDVFGPGNMEYVTAAWTSEKTAINRLLPYLMNAAVLEGTTEGALLICGAGRPIATNVVGSSCESAEIILREPMALEEVLDSYTKTKTIMSVIRQILISRSISAKSYQDSMMSTQVAFPVDFIERSKTDIISSIKAFKSSPCKSVEQSDVIACGTALARQMAKQEAVVQIESIENTTADICQGIFTEAFETSNTQNSTEIRTGTPVLSEGYTLLESVENVDAIATKSKPINSAEMSDTYLDALMALGKVVCFSAYIKSDSYISAIEGEEKVVEWTDPIRKGNNLFITHAWNSWNDENKMFIDIVKFYVPIQKDGNLYIRSAYLSYADGDKGFIDMSVYYEPVKTENDLYIKGAQVAYADGNEGFVDMDVYYEPKQTGKNLYIRSAGSMKGVNDNG